MKLSPHFSLAELTRSQTARRYGIKNEPGGSEINNLQRLALVVLERVRLAFGPFSPSSGFRSPELNRAIGSRDASQHIKGEAADFEVPGVPNLELAEWCRQHLQFDQLILEFWDPEDPSAGWVHASLKNGKNRKQVLTILRIDGKVKTYTGLPSDPDFKGPKPKE